MRAAFLMMVAGVLAGTALVPVLAQAPEPRVMTVPAGTEWLVRLQAPISSGSVKVDQPFDAGLLREHAVQGVVVVPAGAIARGFVSSVRIAGINKSRGSLTLSFQELRIGEQVTRLRASILELFDPRMGGDAERTNLVAVAGGGVVTGPMGGGSGALVGIVVAPSGALTAADGGDVTLPGGTVLRIKLSQPVSVSLR